MATPLRTHPHIRRQFGHRAQNIRRAISAIANGKKSVWFLHTGGKNTAPAMILKTARHRAHAVGQKRRTNGVTGKTAKRRAV